MSSIIALPIGQPYYHSKGFGQSLANSYCHRIAFAFGFEVVGVSGDSQKSIFDAGSLSALTGQLCCRARAIVSEVSKIVDFVFGKALIVSFVFGRSGHSS